MNIPQVGSTVFRYKGGLLFLVLFAQGETSAPDLCHPADDHKAGGVDLSGQILHQRQLPIGNHAEHHLGVQLVIAAFAIEHGDAPVHFGQNGVPDLLGFSADDLDLSLTGTHQQHFVQRYGNGGNQQNAVKQILQGVIAQLGQQDTEIKNPQADGHRNMEQLHQNQRRDVHAAGGSACPDDDAQRNTQTEADDIGMAVFEYDNAVSFAKTSAVELGGFERRQLVVTGSKKTVEIKPLEWWEGSNITTTRRTATDPLWRGVGEVETTPTFNRYDTMMQSFAAMVRGEKENPWSYDYELELYKLVLKACGE